MNQLINILSHKPRPLRWAQHPYSPAIAQSEPTGARRDAEPVATTYQAQAPGRGPPEPKMAEKLNTSVTSISENIMTGSKLTKNIPAAGQQAGSKSACIDTKVKRPMLADGPTARR